MNLFNQLSDRDNEDEYGKNVINYAINRGC